MKIRFKVFRAQRRRQGRERAPRKETRTPSCRTWSMNQRDEQSARGLPSENLHRRAEHSCATREGPSTSIRWPRARVRWPRAMQPCGHAHARLFTCMLSMVTRVSPMVACNPADGHVLAATLAHLMSSPPSQVRVPSQKVRGSDATL